MWIELKNSEGAVSKRRHWTRKLVERFKPAWFASSMGTGIVAINLYAMPYLSTWTQPASVAVFVGNAVLFTALVLIGSLRILLERNSWRPMFDAHGQGLFLGTIPMAFATLIIMWTNVCVPLWGPMALETAWGLWIANEVISIGVMLGYMVALSIHPLRPFSDLNPIFILPFVTPIVSVGAGATVLSVLPQPQYAHRTIFTLYLSYASIGLGLSFSLILLAAYYIHLFRYGRPRPSARASVLVPLSPLGQSAGALLILGRVAVEIAESGGGLDTVFGENLLDDGFLVAVCLFIVGITWSVIAIFITIWVELRMRWSCNCRMVAEGNDERLRFGAQWWGFVFPLGVYAFAALQMGSVLGNSENEVEAWGVVGTVLTVWVVVHWSVAIGVVLRDTWRYAYDTKH